MYFFLDDSSTIAIVDYMGNNFLQKVNAKGITDSSFGIYGKLKLTVNNTNIKLVAIHKVNQAIIGYGFLVDSVSNSIPCVVKIDYNGTYSNTFANNGVQFFYNFSNHVLKDHLQIDAQNNIYFLHSLLDTFYISKLKSNGLVDASFGNNGSFKSVTNVSYSYAKITDMVLTDSFICLVKPRKIVNKYQAELTKIFVNGQIDSSFGIYGNGIISNTKNLYNAYNDVHLFYTAQNNFLLFYNTQIQNKLEASIARINANGTLDTSYGTSGFYYPVNSFGYNAL